MPAPALTTRWETSEVAVSVMAPMTVQLPAADCALAAFATRAISFGHSSDQKEKELLSDAATSDNSATRWGSAEWQPVTKLGVSAVPGPANGRAYAGPRSSCSLRSFRSTAPSHDAITIVASALPRMLTATKAEDIKRCTPRMIPTAATGTVPVAARVDTSTTIAEPETPAPPLDVTSKMPNRPSCCPRERSRPTACTIKMDAAAK